MISEKTSNRISVALWTLSFATNFIASVAAGRIHSFVLMVLSGIALIYYMKKGADNGW